MRPTLLFLIALTTTGATLAADAPATKPAAKPTTEQVMAQFRSDMQSKRADVMAKGLTLTAEQAAKFWPLFDQFQKEQNAIIDGQFKATQRYSDNYQTLDDAAALEYVNALLARDSQMHELRLKWLAKFQTVVPARTAARAIQIDRRLSQVAQVQMSMQIPLVR